MSLLTNAEQEILLRIAREALEAGVAERALPDPGPVPDALLIRCGAFVTLHKTGKLRGCIGHIEGWGPLVRVVQECAVSAALHDPRFNPVTPEEVPWIRIETSVLSPLFALTPDEIEVGKHGLLVTLGSRRGLLLPQVAVEWKWDRQQFLQETCVKAGLPLDAWRRGAIIRGFTADVFGEPVEPSTYSSPFTPRVSAPVK
jgi:AmmeMemoRadiSam system protein A